MKEEDLSRFRKAMERLKISLPSSIRLTERQEALRIDEYWAIFKTYSIESFEEGVGKAISELRRFPSPVELKEFVNLEVERIYWESNKNIPLLELPKMSAEEAAKKFKEILEQLDKKHGTKILKSFKRR